MLKGKDFRLSGGAQVEGGKSSLVGIMQGNRHEVGTIAGWSASRGYKGGVS